MPARCRGQRTDAERMSFAWMQTGSSGRRIDALPRPISYERFALVFRLSAASLMDARHFKPLRR